MKLKAQLPDGVFTVPARYKNSSAPVNVDVVVVDGHVIVSQEVGRAILDHDTDNALGRFEYVNDDMPTEEPQSFYTVASVDPPAEPLQEGQEGTSKGDEGGADAGQSGETAPTGKAKSSKAK
jgi:hypothetical protein